MEIELSSESASSFKVGESGSATFVLKNTANFSSISWKATLPSGTSVTSGANEDTLTVDLSSESAGTLVIEVSAVSSDTSKAGCLTYRKKEIDVGANLTPYLNPISFSDGRNEVEVTLESNDIYKYSRPQTTRYLQIEILNADSCQYQINNGSATVFSCSGELIEIPSSTDTGCVQGIITVSASNVQGGSLSQSYYHYCLEDGDYCYFGPTSARPSDHVCSRDLASQSDGESQKGVGLDTDPKAQGRSGLDLDPSVTTTTLSCPSDQYTSSSACSTAKPSNSTCSAQGNGCYGWSCNSGYRKDGNSCVVCTTSASCNSSKPANSTCSADSNGCYSWSCSSGYTKSNNSCVRLQGPSCGTGRNTCNPGTANDGAVPDTTSTYKWRCSHNGQNIDSCFSCKSGYQRSGSSCVRLQGPSCGTSRNTCNPGTANDGAVPDTTSSYKWRCSHNGQNIDSCFSCKSGYQRSGSSCVRLQGPSCGTSRNTCNPGTANDGAVADTTSSYKWRCSHNGQNIDSCFSCKSGYQRSGSSCVRLQGPSCGTSRNTCNPGTANDGAVADTTSSYKWRCSHNGQNIDSCFSCKSGYQRSGSSCARIPSPPVIPPSPVTLTPQPSCTCNNSQNNGCGNGCSATQSPADTQTHYRWTCTRSGYQSSGTCSTAKPQPSCTCNNSQNNGCGNGCSATQSPADTQTHYRWTCTRSGYQSSGTCSTAKPQPSCTCNNSQNNGCGNGCSATQSPADTQTHYRWTCTRSGYQSSGTCSAAKPQPSCTCNNSQNNGCGNGCSATQSPADTQTHYRWTCTRSGYQSSGTCSAAKPQPSCTCNNSQNNGCGNGCSATQSPADTQTHYRWTCTRSGYQSSGTCSAAKPQPSCTCNNSQNNGCGNGCSATQSPADTQTHYRWTCTRSGYQSSGTCSTAKPQPAVHGSCRSTHYSCSSGTSINNNAGSSQWTWQCQGSNGGRTVSCSERRPTTTTRRPTTTTRDPCAGVNCGSGRVCSNGSCVCNTPHYGGANCLPSCGHYKNLNNADVSGRYCRESTTHYAGSQVQSYQTCCTKGAAKPTSPDPVCGPSSAPLGGGTCRVGELSRNCSCPTSTTCSFGCRSGTKTISCECGAGGR